MLRLRSISVGRLGHFCSVGQRTCRRTTLTAGDKWPACPGSRARRARSAERSATTRTVDRLSVRGGPGARRHAASLEAVSLLIDECTLPDEGRGLLEFSEISSAAGRDWTDNGEVHQVSKPKGGPRNAVRRVPIPPVLVTLLREHVQEQAQRRMGGCSRATVVPSTSLRPCARCCEGPGRKSCRPRSWPLR
jgi:hypothetical protein